MTGCFMNNESIWNLFLDNLSQRIADVSFNTWFKNTSLISIDDNKIVIGVPMHFQKKFLMIN